MIVFYCQKGTISEKRDPSLHRKPIFKPEKLVVESFVNLLRLFLDLLQWGRNGLWAALSNSQTHNWVVFRTMLNLLGDD